jgi:tetratricopeptide (TPR) repeat protein
VPENPRIEELRRRVQADPASIAFAALAEEFRRVGQHEEAIATCRTGLQRHPAYLSARVTLGRALIEVGEYEAAREELETVLRSAPENLAAIRGLALIHERLGHSAEMHPDLHALAQEPIRLAAENRAREAELPPAVSSLGAFDLSLSSPLEPASIDDEPKTGEAFDIFGAALKRDTAAEVPDAHLAAMLTRLERFLGAIETARSA